MGFGYSVIRNERQWKATTGLSQVKILTSGSLLIDYGYQVWVWNNPIYYNKFIYGMFPIVLDDIKSASSFEPRNMFFSTDLRPDSPQSEWDPSQEIDGYQLEL